VDAKDRRIVEQDREIAQSTRFKKKPFNALHCGENRRKKNSG
jgi:hypothetical protein